MTSVVGFILTLSILVLIHEWGHYRVARLCGVHVMAFSLGFGKILWRHTDKRGCEWRLSAIPLGGYVKMLDSTDREAYEEEGLRFTEAQYAKAFDRQSVYKRFAVVAAGPLMNLVLAVVLYAGVAMMGTYQPSTLLDTPAVQSQAHEAGVARGWRVDSVAERRVETLNDVRFQLVSHIGSERVPVTFFTPESRLLTVDFDLSKVEAGKEDPFIAMGLRLYTEYVVIANVVPGSPAEAAGLVRGDKVLSINGTPVTSAQHMIALVRASKGKAVDITVQTQAGGQATYRLQARQEQTPEGELVWRIGAGLGGMPDLIEVREGVFEALGTGCARVWDFVSMTFGTFAKMVGGQVGTDSIGGPLTIGNMAGESLESGVLPFVLFLAMLSVSLGAINLFPIPALDGGHLVFFLYEMAFGRPPSEKVRSIAQKAGLILIFALMLLALGNDFSRLFR